MESPGRRVPPSNTRHNIPRRPLSSLRSPGRIRSIKLQGVQVIVTSRRASPTRSCSPICKLFTFRPSLVMFSLRRPGANPMASRVSRSTSSTWRFPPGCACAHPSKPKSVRSRASRSPSMGNRLFGARNKLCTLAIAFSFHLPSSNSPAARCLCGSASGRSESFRPRHTLKLKPCLGLGRRHSLPAPARHS